MFLKQPSRTWVNYCISRPKKSLPTISFDKLLLLRFLKFGEFVRTTNDFVGTHTCLVTVSLKGNDERPTKPQESFGKFQELGDLQQEMEMQGS